jgi:hypothetical protein
VDNYLFNDLGLKAKDVAFVTSASYAGIDKAAMDFAKNRNIDVVNITPYCYAEWMDTNLKHPLLVTESVDDYAKACAEAANLLLVTGGRGHAYQQDFKRFMVDENKAVLAVDVMKEGLNLKVPALNKGVVDNAAALLIEKGFNAENADFAKNVRNAANLTPMQRVVAGALETLHRQFTFTNEKAIAEKL